MVLANPMGFTKMGMTFAWLVIQSRQMVNRLHVVFDLKLSQMVVNARRPMKAFKQQWIDQESLNDQCRTRPCVMTARGQI
jgi:hypothetical protein